MNLERRLLMKKNVDCIKKSDFLKEMKRYGIGIVILMVFVYILFYPTYSITERYSKLESQNWKIFRIENEKTQKYFRNLTNDLELSSENSTTVTSITLKTTKTEKSTVQSTTSQRSAIPGFSRYFSLLGIVSGIADLCNEYSKKNKFHYCNYKQFH